MEDGHLLHSGLGTEWSLADPTSAIDVQLKEVFGSDDEEDFPLSHGVLEEGGGASQLLFSSIDESLDVLNATDQSDSLVGSDGKHLEAIKPVSQENTTTGIFILESEGSQGDSLSDHKEEEEEEKKPAPIRQSARLRKRKETFVLKSEDLVRPSLKVKTTGAKVEEAKSPVKVAKEEEEGEEESKSQGDKREEEAEEEGKGRTGLGKKRTPVRKGKGSDAGGRRGKLRKVTDEETTDTGGSGLEESSSSPAQPRKQKTPQKGEGVKKEGVDMDVTTEDRETEMETETGEEEAEDEEEGEESDDPDRLWCICQQPHNDRCVCTTDPTIEQV